MAEAADQDPATEKPEEPKKVWNSLEVTKLFVGASTPLLIFAFGMMFTLSSQKAVADRENQVAAIANEREDARTKAAAAAEVARREEARRDASQAADLANERERELQAEASAREEATRRATEAREARLRAEARTENLQSRILERRIQVWNQLAPRIARLHRNMRIDVIPDGNAGAEARRNLEVQSEALLELVTTVDAYRPYFSEAFYLAFTDFRNATEDVLQHSRTPRGSSFQQQLGLGRAYRRLLEATRADLAVPGRSD